MPSEIDMVSLKSLWIPLKRSLLRRCGLEFNLFTVLQAKDLGREHVITVTGKVIERSAKFDSPTGDIEISPTSIETLSPSLTPPFLIEDKTDG